MVFIINKDKWKFHLLPFGINLGPSAFLYVLGKVLALCLEFALNYLDDIIIFSRTWEDHVRHLEEVFKQLKHVDLKIKCSKCKFFKSQVHYLGYMVGVSRVQPLPEKGKAIKKLVAPTDVNELHQFLGVTCFYRKFVLFYADITNCLTKLLRKGTGFTWSDQCNDVFNIVKEELCKMPSLQSPDPKQTIQMVYRCTQPQLFWHPKSSMWGRPYSTNTNSLLFRMFQQNTATLVHNQKSMLCSV